MYNPNSIRMTIKKTKKSGDCAEKVRRLCGESAEKVRPHFLRTISAFFFLCVCIPHA